MEKYNNILKAIIGLPLLSVKASNPYPIVGETVELNSESKWLFTHEYTLNDGVESTAETTAALLGKTSHSITVKSTGDIEQTISGMNTSGRVVVKKTLYAGTAAVEPYFDFSVKKEIIRNDGETTNLILKPEFGYDFSREKNIRVRIYLENAETSPVRTFTEADFLLGGGVLLSSNFSFTTRGIYDIEIDFKDVETDTTITKRINKLITVTPALAPRASAYEYVIPNAKVVGNIQDWYIDAKNYPAGCTIVLKLDEFYGGEYPTRLRFINFQGTWEKPCIITIDQATPLVMRWFSYFGIYVENCKHIVFDGRGYQNISRGIHMKPLPEDSTTAIQSGTMSEEIEIFEIEIDGAGFAGMVVKTDPNENNPEAWFPTFHFNRLLVHHMYIHDTAGEGVYLGYFSMSTKTGTNSSGKPVTFRAHHMFDSRIYRCLFLRNGYDAIQWNNAENLEICYNQLINPGARGEKDQASGMSLGLSGKIYCNLILDYQGPGIQFGACGELHIFNNIIVNGKAGSGGLLLLASSDVPEQNPNNDNMNYLPVYIYNNIITSIGQNALNSRNTTQFMNLHFEDNFCIAKYGLFAGQATATIAEWERNAKNNVLKQSKRLDFVEFDNTYKFADSSNGDYRIAKKSILMKGGLGNRFKMDYRGYKNWYQSLYPVGPYLGVMRDADVDESFRILSVTFDNDVVQTINNYVMVSWTYYGNTVIKEYRISEDSTFEGGPWQTYNNDSGGQFRYNFAGSAKGKRTIYVQLKNENDKVSEPFSKEITWVYRTAMIGVNTTSSTNSDGEFNSDTGILYLRFQNKAGTLYNFKDTLGNKMGTIVINRSFTVYNSNGVTTGDNSGIFLDLVLQKNEAVMFESTAKTFDPPTVFTLDINPGNYGVSIFCNSNCKQVNDNAVLVATPYFKLEANGISTTAAVLKNNFNTLVKMDNVVVTTDRVLTITAAWDENVSKVVQNVGPIFGAINLIKIEEI
ncbi:MAG: hypothetical protein RR206_04800 [Bacteroidaceae bacterium]